MLIVNLLIRVLGQPGHSSDMGRQHKFNCPNCAELYNQGKPDGKYNLEVNLAKQSKGVLTRVWHCWKCEQSGEVGTLLRRWGGYNYFEQYKSMTSQEEFSLVLPKAKEKRVVRLPEEYSPFFGSTARPQDYEYKRALAYLTSRGVNEAVIRQLKVGYCGVGRYQNRIVIPSYDRHGALNYFAARSYVGHEDKYMNPGIDKMTIIFNESNINWDAPVFLTEGPFELLAFPMNNIVLLGKVLPDALLQRLIAKNARVIVALNADAMERKHANTAPSEIISTKRERAASIMEIGKTLIESGLGHVRWWNLPENDLGKLLRTSGESGIFSSLATNVREFDFVAGR